MIAFVARIERAPLSTRLLLISIARIYVDGTTSTPQLKLKRMWSPAVPHPSEFGTENVYGERLHLERGRSSNHAIRRNDIEAPIVITLDE